MERIKIFRNQPFVLIDDDFGEMMNWAVRYALGRRTYAVGDTCRFVKSVLPYLDDKTLFVMARDIKEKSYFNDLGDQCDADNWLDLMKAITEQMKGMVDDETNRR